MKLRIAMVAALTLNGSGVWAAGMAGAPAQVAGSMLEDVQMKAVPKNAPTTSGYAKIWGVSPEYLAKLHPEPKVDYQGPQLWPVVDQTLHSLNVEVDNIKRVKAATPKGDAPRQFVVKRSAEGADALVQGMNEGIIPAIHLYGRALSDLAELRTLVITIAGGNNKAKIQAGQTGGGAKATSAEQAAAQQAQMQLDLTKLRAYTLMDNIHAALEAIPSRVTMGEAYVAPALAAAEQVKNQGGQYENVMHRGGGSSPMGGTDAAGGGSEAGARTIVTNAAGVQNLGQQIQDNQRLLAEFVSSNGRLTVALKEVIRCSQASLDAANAQINSPGSASARSSRQLADSANDAAVAAVEAANRGLYAGPFPASGTGGDGSPFSGVSALAYAGGGARLVPALQSDRPSNRGLRRGQTDATHLQGT